VALADDDDGFAGRSDHSDDLLHIVVPDDLRELDAEVAAYRRELEAARKQERRRRRVHRFLPKWAHSGLPSPVFTVVLLLIATTGLMLSVFAPVTRVTHQHLDGHSEPLARPTVQAPSIGALLPSVELVAQDGIVVSSHELRAAVVVLLPSGCDCADLITQIIGQANELPPTVYVALVSAGTDDTAYRLANSRDAGGGPIAVRDRAGTLAKTYGATTTGNQPTLLLVHADGTLARSPVLFTDKTRLETDLLQLRR
jgi:hypothetical protein